MAITKHTGSRQDAYLALRLMPGEVRAFPSRYLSPMAFRRMAHTVCCPRGNGNSLSTRLDKDVCGVLQL